MGAAVAIGAAAFGAVAELGTVATVGRGSGYYVPPYGWAWQAWRRLLALVVRLVGLVLLTLGVRNEWSKGFLPLHSFAVAV